MARVWEVTSIVSLDQNNQGRYASFNLQNKVVRQHESTSPRCHVKILDNYLAVITRDAKENDAFI